MENAQTQIKINGPRDVFLELWIVGTLYLSASFIVTLLFQYINYFLKIWRTLTLFRNQRYAGPWQF